MEKQATINFSIRKSARIKGNSYSENKLTKSSDKSQLKVTPVKGQSRRKLTFDSQDGETNEKGDVEVVEVAKTTKADHLGERASRNKTPKKSPNRSGENCAEWTSPAKIAKKEVDRQVSGNKAKADLSLPARVKVALSSSSTDHLVGRDSEFQVISEFIAQQLENKQSSSLYISGPPGTGKTVCVNHVVNSLAKSREFETIFINCMNFKISKLIYAKLLKELNVKSTDSTAIKSCIQKRSSMLVLVLDEIDQLDDRNHDVLHTIFEWASSKESKLILIGIANALDFTSRTLSRLNVLGVSPTKELHFQPYNKNQIVDIIESRLNNLADKQIINAAAIQLCARKVSSSSGDIRKALDVCRRAIDLVQVEGKEQNSTPLKITNDDRCNPGSPRKVFNKHLTVDVPQIMKVINQIYGSKSDVNKNLQTTLPFQQQVVLCAVLIFTKQKKLKEMTLGKCFEIYTKICKIQGISCDHKSESDFLTMCQLLEANGYISIKNVAQFRLSKLSLQIEQSQVEYMLSDKSLLKSLLEKSSIFIN